MYNFHVDFSLPSKTNSVFVFGSNLLGHHGGGSARIAYEKFDATWGVGIGHTGQSYAIPTCGAPGGQPKLSLEEIKTYVQDLIQFANDNPHITFFVTRIGCGIAGNKDEDIAPLFIGFPINVDFPIEWQHVLTS